MKNKIYKRNFSIFTVFLSLLLLFLASCQKEIINYEPLIALKELSCTSPGRFENTPKDEVFYLLDCESQLDSLIEKHNLSFKGRSLLGKEFFEKNILAITIVNNGGNCIIAGELTEDSLIFHRYSAFATDCVIINFCFSCFIPKEKLGVRIESLKIFSDFAILNNKEFIGLENFPNLISF